MLLRSFSKLLSYRLVQSTSMNCYDHVGFCVKFFWQMQLSSEEFRPSLAKHSVGRNNATSSAQILQSNNSLVRKKNVRLSPLTSFFSRKNWKILFNPMWVFYGEKKVQFEIVRKWKSVWENKSVFLDFCKRLWKWVRLKNIFPFCLNPMRMKFCGW